MLSRPPLSPLLSDDDHLIVLRDPKGMKFKQGGLCQWHETTSGVTVGNYNVAGERGKFFIRVVNLGNPCDLRLAEVSPVTEE